MGQISVSISGFSSFVTSAITQLCCCNAKVAIEIRTNEGLRLCSNKTLFTKNSTLDLTRASSFSIHLKGLWKPLKWKDSMRSQVISDCLHFPKHLIRYLVQLKSVLLNWGVLRCSEAHLYYRIKNQWTAFYPNPRHICIFMGTKASSYETEDERVELQTEPAEIHGRARGVF